MKRQNSNLFLLLLVSVLVIMLALSCEGATDQNSNGEYVWANCPGWALAEDIAIRVEDLPAGWQLWEVQTGPTCEYPFSIRAEAFVSMSFQDEKPWNNPRTYVSNWIELRWEDQAVMHYFLVQEDSVAINITGADEAYIGVWFEQVQEPGEPAVNCASGAFLKFRKGLYDVYIRSFNMDLRDLCIEEGEEVDAELAFVTDLATEVASRIP